MTRPKLSRRIKKSLFVVILMIAVYAFFRSYAVQVQDMENKNTSSDNLIDSLIPLVPTQYIMPPGGDERDFSSHNLKKLVSQLLARQQNQEAFRA